MANCPQRLKKASRIDFMLFVLYNQETEIITSLPVFELKDFVRILFCQGWLAQYTLLLQFLVNT